MSIHPDGTGTGWTNVEAVDVDQPHGKDYLYSQHIAKGVRKRINKQHVAFGDTTAGGEHVPGGCSILDIVDATTDISINDSTYVGRNLVYDQTNSAFWCFTNTDYTASTPAAYKLMFGPKSICLGADFTWTGAHEFDASVDISGNVAMDGDFSVDGTAAFTDASFDGTVDFGDGVAFGVEVSIDGTLSVGGDVAFVSDVSIDGTLAIQDIVLTGDSTFTFDPIAGETGPIFKIFGDWSSRANNTTYTARTDGIVCARNANTTAIKGATPSGSLRAINRMNAGTGGSSITMPVKSGHTWDVSGAASVYWLPFGDNT